MTIFKHKNEYLLVELYKPSTLEDCILLPRIYDIFNSFKLSGELPNLILTGKAGIGKTSTIEVLCKELNYEVYKINGSSEGRYLATIQNNVVQYCTTYSMTNPGNKKVVLFDEFDNTLPDVQLCLRGVIEQYQNNVIFVFTCNSYNKILEPIRSRCSTILFPTPVSFEDRNYIGKKVYELLNKICKDKSIKASKSDILKLIKQYSPDIRKILNEFQKGCVDGVFNIPLYSNGDISELIDFIKSKNFDSVREWILLNLHDCTQFYTNLYNNLKNYIEEDSIPSSILILNDYQYRHHFVLDLELHLYACIIELSNTVKFK